MRPQSAHQMEALREFSPPWRAFRFGRQPCPTIRGFRAYAVAMRPAPLSKLLDLAVLSSKRGLSSLSAIPVSSHLGSRFRPLHAPRNNGTAGIDAAFTVVA
jgi:hypothetical protein